MNQLAILKKKGSNPNKAQNPLKNLDAEMKYRSSVELVNTFKIKREHVANELNNKATKKRVPIALKRKNSKDFIPQQRKSKLVGHKSVIQSSSREELSTSHMIVGKGQNKPRLFQSGESIQEKGFKLPMHNFRFRMSSKEGVTSFVHVSGTTLGIGEEQHDIQDLLSFKQINHTVVVVEYIPAPSIHEHNKGLDALDDQEEISEDECAIDEEVDINCSTKGILKQKKVQGKTTCKNIHARNLEEREEVTFDKGQAVGLTDKIVSKLTNFIGTMAKNPRFINLIIVEDMLAKRPDDIPEAQFCQLIEYWKRPTVQAISEGNSKNRKQQQWRHRMGPINFARVCVALRATKENNEEPSQPKMFIATRTKMGKEIQADTQVAINRQNSGETTDDAFRAVFGKEKPDRLRCYGRSVTTSSLKKDKETNKLKQKHANEISTLKEEINEMRVEVRHFLVNCCKTTLD
ncbi:hypothetical protein KY290_010809 [Solanum tuberosum]|uniref:Uncharacterized protein n=1 Tax=Solanum tuberosum TaxID=4113 RepID=A0ABQ7W1F5_SOLTU|nr:hypothetical protein KY290_010809 [Solanum tuberosum]